MNIDALNRNLQALKLREEGKTFKEIGELIGRAEDGKPLSVERARQRVKAAERHKTRLEEGVGYWYFGLLPRTFKSLLYFGYDSKDSVVQGISSGHVLKQFDKSVRDELQFWVGGFNNDA